VFFCKRWAPFCEIKQSWAPLVPWFSGILPKFSEILPKFSTNQKFKFERTFVTPAPSPPTPLGLHVKLGLSKQYVKDLTATGICFNYICRSFPALTIKNLKSSIFQVPHILQFLKDPSCSLWYTRSLLLGNHLLQSLRTYLENIKLKIVQR